MQKKMIVFDMDGTLADTRSFVIQTLNELAPSFDYNRLEQEDVRELRNSRSIHFFKVLGIPLWRAPFLVKKVQNRLSDVIESLELIEGMNEVLTRLKSEEIILGVATSNSKVNADKFFSKFKGEYFDFRASGILPYTKHRALKKIAKKNNISTDCMYYVGDETRDILSSKKAGVKVIAVTWGFNSREILETMNPDFIADKPDDIITYLEDKGWKLCT